MFGVNPSELARLGELGQGPVDFHEELYVLGPYRQGHVPSFARSIPGHEPETELRVPMQVPGREVCVEERGVQLCGPESLEQLFTGLESRHRMVLLREGDRASHDPDPFRAKVGQGMNIARTPWDNEAELGQCVRNAPGNVARRPRVEGLADHDMASTLR
jgi:hypothetical protein